MIVVRLNNGEVHRDVVNWEQFDIKNGIKDIILTDGDKLQTVISGYDSYTVEREAIAGWSGDRMLTKEIVYGYRDLTSCKQQLLDAFNRKVKNIIDQDFDKEETKASLNSSKQNYDILLDRLEQREVDIYTLNVTISNKKRKGIKFVPAAIKGNSKQQYDVTNFIGQGYEKRI